MAASGQFQSLIGGFQACTDCDSSNTDPDFVSVSPGLTQVVSTSGKERYSTPAFFEPDFDVRLSRSTVSCVLCFQPPGLA